MQPTKQALFLSLKPSFAEMIMSGDKTVELRRIRPRALPGTMAFIYASSPVMELIGTSIIEEISIATPREIWRLHGPATGLKWRGLTDYFHDVDHGVAISLGTPTRFEQPVSLERVRGYLGESAPPQSFRYINHQNALKLIRAGKAHAIPA